MEDERSMNYELKAIEMWELFDENERSLVAFAIFPHRQMTEAEEAGYKTHPLVVALMRIEKANRRSGTNGKTQQTKRRK